MRLHDRRYEGHCVVARAPRHRAWFLVWVGIVVLSTGCSKRDSESSGQAMPEPLDPAEARRGTEACDAYIEQVCNCAKTRPDDREIGDLCHMAPAKQSSLAAVVEVNRTTSDARERYSTTRVARRIIKSCIEEQSRLLASGCRPGGSRASPGGRQNTSDR
ncbi:MAG: hypothetical protein MJE77_07995 [Proteobacteria bacterium]|nr:hypothetical protein [Pseudomonadota bacterium]